MASHAASLASGLASSAAVSAHRLPLPSAPSRAAWKQGLESLSGRPVDEGLRLCACASQVVSGLELSDNFSCCSVQGAHRLSQMRTAAFWREPTAKSARLLSAEERAALASSAADGRASALLLVSEERMLQEKSQAGDIAPLTGPAKSDECGFGGECRGLYVVATACACGGVVKLLSDGRLFFLQKQARTPDPCGESASDLRKAFPYARVHGCEWQSVSRLC